MVARIVSFLVLYFVLLSSISLVSSEKNITVETFGDEPKHVWFTINDPVMGGVSTGFFFVKDGVGIFDGEVKDVPKLGGPGFLSMRTGSGESFPDLRTCHGLILDMKSVSSYGGFRASLGTNFAGTMPYAQGYKTHFDAPVGNFGEVKIPFEEFSDNWDPKTGQIVVSCSDNNQYCPDDETLYDLKRLEIMAEGVNGKIHLEIKSIHAYGCDDDASETASGKAKNFDDNEKESSEDDVKYDSAGYIQPSIMENGDIRIESFDNPKHKWFANNDPIMGGKSTSTVSVQKDTGIFVGEVVDVPFLESPGFIKMETRGGYFPDVSMCKALKIRLKSENYYSGFRVTFGTHHAPNTKPYVRGYKAHIDPPVNKFGDVKLRFSDFSDAWDPKTGDVVTFCTENPDNCVDHKTLRDFTTLSFMGEGVNGKVHLEIKSIDATDCSHVVEDSQTNSTNDKTAIIESVIWAMLAVGFFLIASIAFATGFKLGKTHVESPDIVASDREVV